MFISLAHASENTPAGGGMETLIMLAMFGLIFYFLIFRPQSKRVKEHKNLMGSLEKGNEVITTGGLIGRIVKISEDNAYVKIALNDTQEVLIKRDFITAVLPKGTIKSL